MAENDSYDDLELRAPPRLIAALQRSQPPVHVPSEIDDAILQQARRHPQSAPVPVGAGPERSPGGPAPALDLSRWLWRLAALAACLLALAGICVLVKAILPHHRGGRIEPMLIRPANVPSPHPQTTTNSPAGNQAVQPVLVPGK